MMWLPMPHSQRSRSLTSWEAAKHSFFHVRSLRAWFPLVGDKLKPKNLKPARKRDSLPITPKRKDPSIRATSKISMISRTLWIISWYLKRPILQIRCKRSSKRPARKMFLREWELRFKLISRVISFLKKWTCSLSKSASKRAFRKSLSVVVKISSIQSGGFSHLLQIVMLLAE